MLMNNTLSKSKITTSLALLIIASATMANAAPEKKAPTPPEKRATQQRTKQRTKQKTESTKQDLLRGPTVKDTTTESSKTHDSMNQAPNKRTQQRTQRNKPNQTQRQTGPRNTQGARPGKLQEFQNALRQFMGKNAPADLGLTIDQRKQIKLIVTEQRQAMAKFRSEHQSEFNALRAELKAERSAKRQGQSKEQQSKNATKQRSPSPAQEKMRAFMASSPADGIAFEKIKAVLTPEQLSIVKSQIKAMQKNRANGKGPLSRQARPNQQRPNAKRQRNNTSETSRPNAPRVHRKKMNPNDATSTGNKSKQRKKHSNGKDG